jgi:hypothetical protein
MSILEHLLLTCFAYLTCTELTFLSTDDMSLSSLMTCKSRLKCHKNEMLLLESRMRGYTTRQLPTNQRLPSQYVNKSNGLPNLISFVTTLERISEKEEDQTQ